MLWFPAPIRGFFFLSVTVRAGSAANQATINVSPGSKAGREGNHSSQWNAEFRNEWSETSTLPYVFLALLLIKHWNSFTLEGFAFSHVTPCILLGFYGRFGRRCCLHRRGVVTYRGHRENLKICHFLPVRSKYAPQNSVLNTLCVCSLRARNRHTLAEQDVKYSMLVDNVQERKAENPY